MAESIKTHVHKLAGCQSSPLAHYLKAIGILRLVTEQVDETARGWWQADEFQLATRLDRQSLESFFLYQYSPTPILAPWNGGSGFFPKDKTARESGLEPIVASTADRVSDYREAIAQAQSCVSHLKEKPEKGFEKNSIIAMCSRLWRGSAQHWLNAALAIGTDGNPAFPAMLGTGGNDGRLEFTANFMQRLVSLFDMQDASAVAFAESAPQLRTALWSSLTPTLEKGAIGQFLPGAAGGPNGSNGFSGGVRVNPWDFVLMLEGAVLFASGLSRRCQTESLPQAAAPFAVRSSGSGYGSADDADAGPRGEQWMPLWSFPSSRREVESLLREGRCQISGKAASRGTDMARAVARLGVARGIDRFERYGYIERNGLSNLAVPLGRFDVVPRPNQRLLDEVTGWTDRLRRLASDKNAPSAIARVHHGCEEAVFNCARRGTGADFQSLLVLLGQAEDQLLASPKFSAERFARPLPRLSGRWLQVATEDSADWRLAIAIASQSGPLNTKDTRWSSIRHHWVPLDPSGNGFAKGESGLNIGPEQSAIGLNLERALLAVTHRRLLAMGRGAGEGCLPLRPVNSVFGATLEDVNAFLTGAVNDSRILALARGLMSVKFPREQQIGVDPTTDATPLGGLALYGVLRLALPVRSIWIPNHGDVEVRCNPTVFHRLRTGSVSSAVNVAVRRLAAAGLRPRLQMGVGSPSLGRRLAAAMALGLQQREWTRLALGLTRPNLSQIDHEQPELV